MNRILLIVALLVFCAGIGLSNGELYKWVDKDGVEHFSDYKTDIPPGTLFEAQDEILFDPAADAEREKQDQKTMEAVNNEESEMISKTKREEEQAAQRDKAETPAPTVIEEEGDDNDDSYWRDHEARREKALHDTNRVNEHHETKDSRVKEAR